MSQNLSSAAVVIGALRVKKPIFFQGIFQESNDIFRCHNIQTSSISLRNS